MPPDWVNLYSKISTNVNQFYLKTYNDQTGMQVMVERCGDSLFLGSGWNYVVTQCGLLKGDICLFDYHKDNSFYISCFGPDACERRIWKQPTKPRTDPTADNVPNPLFLHSTNVVNDVVHGDQVISFEVPKGNILRFPQCLKDLHGIKEGSEIQVMNLDGSDVIWRIKNEAKKDGLKLYVSGGWYKFKVVNELKAGSVCRMKVFDEGMKLQLIEVIQPGSSS